VIALSKLLTEPKRKSLSSGKSGDVPSHWLRAACFLLALVPVGYLLWLGCSTLWVVGFSLQGVCFMLFFFGGFSALIVAVEYLASIRLEVSACIVAIVASAFLVANAIVTGCAAMLAYAGFFEMRAATDDWKFVLGISLLAYYGLVTGFCHCALALQIPRPIRSR
jgi:hypothetical protein